MLPDHIQGSSSHEIWKIENAMDKYWAFNIHSFSFYQDEDFFEKKAIIDSANKMILMPPDLFQKFAQNLAKLSSSCVFENDEVYCQCFMKLALPTL